MRPAGPSVYRNQYPSAGDEYDRQMKNVYRYTSEHGELQSIMAGHTPGDPLECYRIPIELHKGPDRNEQGHPILEPDGKQRLRCGFRMGGGIDQDPTKSPQGYPDKGLYITFVYENSPAYHAGLQMHDKVLQVNDQDFTVVTHKKAVENIKKKPVLNMLVYRKGVPPLQKPPTQPQYQNYGPPQGQFHNQFSFPPPNSPQPQYAGHY